jgi:hypothetical protein
VLSLFFRAVLGIERIFHFETLEDVGFGLLTAGSRALSRSRLGGLVRAVSTRAVNAFARATQMWGTLQDQIVTLSLDEHVVARFTRKFRIQKGYHTIRNKHMRSEKLFFLHWPATRRFLLLVSTRAKKSLDTIAIEVVRVVRERARLRQLRLILDAGAANSHAALARLNRHFKTVFLIRAPRRPMSVRAWKRLPADSFRRLEEPGRYKDAPPKIVHITETTTLIKGIRRPVRTIVVREEAARGKDRWHALFILHDTTTDSVDLLHEFRTRQHHEQGYRIGVHDMALDTVPSGYPKNGRPDRPGFRPGPITLCGWVTALAWDALRSLTLSLPKVFHLAHPRTLRRWVLEREAELLLTRTHLFVVLASRTGHLWLLPLLRAFNALRVSLPWLAGRVVAIGFVPPPRTSRRRRARALATDAEVSSERMISPAGVWC